jgi:hypothetical protein
LTVTISVAQQRQPASKPVQKPAAVAKSVQKPGAVAKSVQKPARGPAGTAGALNSDDPVAPLAPDCSDKNMRCIDGAVVRVGANTNLQVLGRVPLQLGEPGTPQVLGREIRLVSGKVEIAVAKDRNKNIPMLIRTSQDAAAILEEGEAVAIVAPEAVTFAAAEGKMFTTAKQRWWPLDTGNARTFSRSKPLGEDRPLLQIPKINLARGILMVASGVQRRAQVRLSPVAGAMLYELQVVRITKQGAELVTNLKSSSPVIDLPVLSPGRYKLRARAADAYGLTSPNSPSQNLYVLNYKAVSGDDLDDGAVELGREQRLELLGGEGLEMSYGRASHFVAMPSSVGLDRGRATVVRFREPGGPEARIRLEPIKGDAKVEIGPRFARWPADRVVAKVNLVDERGAPAKNEFHVDIEVTINAKKVDVHWDQQGNVLTAEIPAPVEQGPWVVRVLVRNRAGDVLTREFLEVTERRERTER